MSWVEFALGAFLMAIAIFVVAATLAIVITVWRDIKR